MSAGLCSRDMQPGEIASTDFNGRGHVRVVITERRETRGCQTGIMFRVKPSLRGGSELTWYDSAWFEPVEDLL